MARKYPTAKTVDLVCPYCGILFSRPESYIKKQPASARYCSANCARLCRWRPTRERRAIKQQAREDALAARNAEMCAGFTRAELSAETWKPVLGFELLYSVSSLGRIRRDKGGRGICSAGRLLHFSANRSGYLEVKLYGGHGIKKILSVHSVVISSFVGPRPSGMEVNHRDGERHNNRLSNLEYVTPIENKRDAVQRFVRQAGQKHWTKAGEDANAAKYSADTVRKVRQRALAGTPQTVISRSMGIPLGTVNQIVNRRSWKHI